MKKRVTTRDIADKLGIHYTTVAEALRGSPRVKESTRKQVEETAKKMGYYPDPVLAALNSYRIQSNEPAFQGTLAWVNGFEDQKYFLRETSYYHKDCYAGALERATEFGYHFEDFWLGQPGMTRKRASHILTSRNVAGVILGPQPEDFPELEFDWDKFSVVRIGYSAHDSKIVTVSPDQFQNSQEVYIRAKSIGFKRIGFACPQWLDDRVQRGFSGGFLAARNRFGGRLEEIPLFMDKAYDGDKRAFLRWVKKWNPDVVLVAPKTIYFDFLKEASYRIPEDVSVIWLALPVQDAGLTGYHENGNRIGSNSVDVLVAMIRRYAKGKAPYDRTTLVAGEWQTGTTYRQPKKGRG